MRIAVGLLGLGLTLTACSGSGTPPAAPTVTVTSPFPVAPTADPATLSWVDGFCSAVNGYRLRTNAETEPPGTGPTTVAEAQKALSAQLGGIATRTGEVVDKLAALPPAPEPLAETVRTAFAAKFTTSRDRASSAKTQLDQAKPGDPESQNPASDALKWAQTNLDGTYDPLTPLAQSTELMSAAASAPNCKT
ncbi:MULTISPECIES: hypothetical protein [unclassified Amycolatopsis]|uniref:hypothetical protein n=1 Tax=unclassified Amycolatopsis TaxID=2618356 RepID=UPI002E1C667F|nr:MULTISPECIES: hypothetical protein [unclassified Amycolatopsis]